MNEDVFPIEAGDFPVSHVDFPGWWFQWFFKFSPRSLGKWSNLTKKNWNHQLAQIHGLRKKVDTDNVVPMISVNCWLSFRNISQAFAKPRMEISPRTELYNLFREILLCYFSGTSSGIASPLPTWVIYFKSRKKYFHCWSPSLCSSFSAMNMAMLTHLAPQQSKPKQGKTDW